MSPEPFDLLAVMQGLKVDEISLEHPALKRVALLRGVIEALVTATGADWVGVYRTVEGHASTPAKRCLVKEAYFGAPSRPFFPLTEEFAAHSNNSTVAMKSEACIILDTRALSDDEPYYICDGKVRAEICAPIIDPSTGACIGIIDAEAFKPRFFAVAGDDGEDVDASRRTATILAACKKLGEWGLFADLLAPQ